MNRKHIISVDQLQTIQGQENTVILDCTFPAKRKKMPDELSGQMITGARYFDIKQKFSDVKARFPNTFPSLEQFEKHSRLLGINNDSTIIVYDASGLYSAARVWWMYFTLGHSDVAILDGGLPAWIEAGGDTVPIHVRQEYKTGDYRIQRMTKEVKGFGDIQDNIDSNIYQVIDARSKQRYQCEVDEPRVGLRRGKIPGSINIPFSDLLQNGRFRSDEDILGIVATKINHTQPLIFSCGSGVTACILYAGLHGLIPNEMNIYDGSWTEYGSLTTNNSSNPMSNASIVPVLPSSDLLRDVRWYRDHLGFSWKSGGDKSAVISRGSMVLHLHSVDEKEGSSSGFGTAIKIIVESLDQLHYELLERETIDKEDISLNSSGETSQIGVEDLNNNTLIFVNKNNRHAD